MSPPTGEREGALAEVKRLRDLWREATTALREESLKAGVDNPLPYLTAFERVRALALEAIIGTAAPAQPGEGEPSADEGFAVEREIVRLALADPYLQKETLLGERIDERMERFGLIVENAYGNWDLSDRDENAMRTANATLILLKAELELARALLERRGKGLSGKGDGR